MSNMPLLTMITFLPALGAVIIMLFMKKEQTKAIKGFATAVAVLDFLISLPSGSISIRPKPAFSSWRR